VGVAGVDIVVIVAIVVMVVLGRVATWAGATLGDATAWSQGATHGAGDGIAWCADVELVAD
jgi:hypothetical protein